MLVELVIAAFLATALAPGVTWLRRRGLPNAAAIAVLSIGLLVLIGGLLALLLPPLISGGRGLIDTLPGDLQRLRDDPNVPSYLHDAIDRGRVYVADLPNQLSGRSGVAVSAVSSAFGLAFTVIVVVTLVVFMLAAGPSLRDGALGLVPEAHRPSARRVLDRLGTVVAGYVVGNFIISVIAGVTTALVLLATGVPFVAPLAIWLAVLDTVPLIGATIGALPAVVVAFFVSPTVGIVVVIWFIAYQQIENAVLQPRIYSRTVSLSALTVFVSVLIGTQLAGVIGVLLAIPAAAGVGAVVSELRMLRLLPPPASEAEHGAPADARLTGPAPPA